MQIVVFDIDGTLANIEHRLHYIRKGKKVLQGLAEQPEMGWAMELLAPIPKVGGKQKR